MLLWILMQRQKCIKVIWISKIFSGIGESIHAYFYLTIDAGFHSSEGEKLVYKALQKLNNEYRVIHSCRWLGDESQRRSEGEASTKSCENNINFLTGY